MHVMIEDREAKLIIAQNGTATLHDGKSRQDITGQEAEKLLVGRLTQLRAQLVFELTQKATDSFRLESMLRHYTERVTDVNNLLRLLDAPANTEFAAAIEAASEVSIATPIKEEKPKEPDKLVVIKRRKVYRNALSTTKVPELRNAVEDAQISA